jgi:hypothetical protein
MPNWCFNTAVLTANTYAELEEFIQFAKQTHTSNYYEPFSEVKVQEEQNGVFWNFITPTDLEAYYAKDSPRYSDSLPMSDPDWYKQVEERRLKSNWWYDWNITNWGTKWDVFWEEQDEPSIEQQNDSRFYLVWHFNTAWGAPEPVYHAMAERFPNIEFDFEATEESSAFAGKMAFVNGKVVTDEWVSQPTHEDYDRLDIPSICCGTEYDESCWGHKQEVKA